MILVLTSLSSPNSFESTSSSSSSFSRCQMTSKACSVGLNCPLFSSQPIPTEQKRVRRNIKYFTETEFDAFATALLIMKNTSTIDGLNKYGSAFRNYDFFLAKHIAAATDIRGDQGHESSVFIIFHILLLCEFEESLLSIEPTIGGLPYWDWPDFSFTLFTDDRFGELPGNGTEFQVTTSAFSNWTISNMDNTTWHNKYGPFMHNISLCSYDGVTRNGYFRDPDSYAVDQHLVRMGSGLTAPSHGKCTFAEKFPFLEWHSCIDVSCNIITCNAFVHTIHA